MRLKLSLLLSTLFSFETIVGPLEWSIADAAETNKEALALMQQGKKLLDAGQTRDAESLLRKAVDLDENSSQCKLTYAICLYGLNRYWGALSQLEPVVAADSGNATAYLYLGHCYMKTRKLKDAIKAYECYLELKPNGEEADKYRTLVSVLKAQVPEQEKQKADATTGGDYVKEAVGANVFYWPESRIPITVYIEPGDSVPGYRPEFDDCLRHAFSEWTSVTDKKIRFQIVKDKTKARMLIAWTNDMHAPELKAEAGKASVVQDSEGLTSADIRLLTVDPFKQGPLGCELLYNVCLHEIGHALGLIGHSPYPDDIMYPQLSVQSGISRRDARTLLTIYKAAEESHNIAESSTSSTSSSATDNAEFEQLAPKVQASLLLKQGTQACFAGNYEEAMRILVRVLKLDPDNQVARENLAVSANNLAVKTQSNDERLKLFRRALFWNPDSAPSRANLRSTMEMMNLSPDNFGVRVDQANKLEKNNDLVGACVELAEALKLKPDAQASARLQSLRKQLGVQ